MQSKKRISRVQRNQVRLSRILMDQQASDIRFSKRLHKIISKKTSVNMHLFRLPVVSRGFQSQVNQVQKKYFYALRNYRETKTSQHRTTYLAAKKALRKERRLESAEINQITRLNKNPKGQVKVLVDNQLSIKVNNVAKYYPTKGYVKKALYNVDLEFKKGSFNVILGESGSGKTTLLNIISGLDRATTGEVVINNVNIQSLTDRELTLFRRENIGFVFQSYNLLHSLNVRDNIDVGRTLQNNANRRKNIDELLTKMKMEGESKKMIYELSGGQQQRVSIARALAKTPNILFGDEPTGALDQATSKEVLKIFNEINKQHKTTVIIVTHNPRIAKIANQVIKIQDGMIESVYKNRNPMKVYDL